jgi:hypothetical protein
MPQPTTDPSVTKEDAGYIEHMDDGMRRCSTCVMYNNGSCDLVLGMIEPYGGCNLYEAAPWVNGPKTEVWRLR